MERTLGPGAEIHCGAMPGCLVAPRVQQKEQEAAQEHRVEMAENGLGGRIWEWCLRGHHLPHPEPLMPSPPDSGTAGSAS